MGTRSLTTFIDEHTKEEIVVMYRQYDGYPEGHGRDLINFLNGMKVVNGIPGGKRASQLANGISCLAAQVISHFKKGVGDFYLHAGDTRDYGEEFVYIIYEEDNDLKVKVEDTYNDKVLFDGNTEEMKKWIGKGSSKADITESIVTGKWVSAVKQQEDGFTD
jgi:hypothetical protein